MSKKLRIYQILAEAGIVRSKKEAVLLARSGKIKVDGEEIQSLHYQLNPRKRKVTVDGEEIKQITEKKYFILNKPKGIETTKGNILKLAEKKEVVNPKILPTLYPVGRLDKETTGLLIVTNDRKLGNKILNPKSELRKVYYAEINKKLNEFEAEKLRNGVEIDLEENGIITKYKTKPAEIKIKNGFIEVTITEGKKRQIRRMFETIGCKVIELKRVAVGRINLGNLKEGEFREIKKEEICKEK